MRRRHVAGVMLWARPDWCHRGWRDERVDRGALLAEVAGGLLAEHGVLCPQAGDFAACGVQAGAE